MKTEKGTIKNLLMRAAMLLLLCLTTTVQMAAWQRTPPKYCIDFVKGGLGEVVVQGWAFDPYASDEEIQLVVVAYTRSNENADGYEQVSTEDGYENLIKRFPVESVNSVYNVKGNHGFRLQLPVYAHLFGLDNELTMYVKIYARTFEYNPSNPHCKDYEYLLRTQDDSPYTTVKVVSNSGEGTKDKPFYIYNAKHWDAIADVVNDVSLNAFYADKFFQLHNEKGFEYNDATPVTKMFGTRTRPFTGTFDGKGKTVNVNLSGSMHVAPFAYTDGATIKNLTVTGNIAATWSAGGIVGDGGSSTLNLQNCVCSANISGFYNFAGGLMGWTEEDMKLNISNCLFKGSFTPGDGGKYHPIACKNASEEVKARAVNVYYVNTASPSSGLGSQTVRNATGIPLNNTCVPGEWDEEIIAADGQPYYAIHFNGKRMPYSYGFENNDLDAEGWTSKNGGKIYTTHYEGSHSYLFELNFNDDEYLISPELYFYSAITVSFYYRIYNYRGNCLAYFQVGYSSTSKGIDEFTWDEEIIVNPSGNYHRYERTFPQGTKYVAVKYRKGCEDLIVDSFCFTNSTSPYPASIAMTDLTDKSVLLTWEKPVESDINGYSYQYKKRDEDAWSAESSTTELSANLTGLSPNTDYDFRVRACSSDKTGGFVNYNFTTTIEFPYLYGFENGYLGHQMEDGWHMVNCDVRNVFLEENHYTGIRTFANRDGDKGFAFEGNKEMTTPQYLMTPRLPDDYPILMSFYYENRKPESNNVEKLQVGYSTTTNDISAFTWGDEITAQQLPWTKYENVFPQGTKYIAVAYNCPQRIGLYLDDFSFYRYSYKPKLTNFAVSNLTDQSVTFTWNAPDASATGYAYQYKLATETAWTTEATTTDTSVTLDGLTANTTYDFRIKTIFSDGVSNYVTQRFITESPAVTSFPYTEGFENGMGGWRTLNAHVSTKIFSASTKTFFTSGADYVHSGSYSFEFCPPNKAYDQYLISPQFDAEKALKVSFYSKDYGPTYFQVGYSTTTKAPEDFHWCSNDKAGYDWKQHVVYCPQGTKYIAVKWYHGFFLYLDDFTIEETDVTPTAPFEIAATDITATSADVNWTRNAENFEFKYREKALFLNDSEEGSEPWTTTIGLGYWRTLTLTGDNYVNHITQSTNVLYTADQNGNVIQTDIISVDTWRVSPKVSLTGTLSFLARFYCEPFDEKTDTCEVLVSTTVNNDPDAFTPIGFISHTTTEDFFNMNYYSCSLDSYNGQEGYIAFRHKSNHKSWLILDDIAIYRTTDEWTTLTTTENNVKLTGLEPTTDYEFQMRSLFFDNPSDWTNVITFTTEDYKLLAGNADNATAIGSIADGKKHDVMLQDYTLSRKRDEWNTLCLPFDVTDFDDTDGITFSGTPLQGATVKELTGSSFSDGTLTMSFNEVTAIEAGKPYIVKLAKGADIVINNGADWVRFVSRVAEGESFAGKILVLGGDINVETHMMVGTADHPFCGTFDGDGHTLNLSINSSEADYAAPFRYINGATIRNLKVTGSVSGGQYCAGIVGKAVGGTNSIRNCWMAATVTSQGNNIGGILGHGATSATTISNCYLNGSLNGENIGVFCGGGSAGGTFTAETCWADGTYNVNGSGIDLVMEANGTVNFNNCRHNDRRINQGDYYYNTLVIVLVLEDGSSDSQYVSFLGNQWGLNSKGELIINPSADASSTNIQNPVFKEVVIKQNSPSALSLSYGEFVGAYSPFADNSYRLLDSHNTGNAAFHASYSYDRSSLGEDFVDWYSDATLTSPATAIPFDADGNVTLYAGRWVELADDADNSGTIASIVSTGTQRNRIVLLKDRTLYRDDDWNTLCLPFSMSEAQIEASPLVGVTIMELDASKSNFTGDGMLTLNFKDAYSIEAGRPYIVKWRQPALVIKNTDDWNAFATAVNNGTTYAGKLVKLDASIDISTMAGTADHPFCGIFDGNGHTLNLSIDHYDADYAAPFRYIKGATIRNLKVTGSVNGGQYCAGIVGAAIDGTNRIRNCWMSANVTAQNKDIGGVVGNGTTSCTIISNCFLDGTLTGLGIGVFCGGGTTGAQHILNTCWALGEYNYAIVALGVGGGVNLVKTDGGTVSITNCYHNEKDAIPQGTYRYVLSFGNSNASELAIFLGNQWTTDNSNLLILKPSPVFDNTDIENPKFTGVTIAGDDPTPVKFSGVKFIGTYSPVILPVGDQHNLFLGANNTLFWPSAAHNDANGYKLNSCRAYFNVDPTVTVREFRLNFGDGEASGIENGKLKIENEAGAWYDLQGRKLASVGAAPRVCPPSASVGAGPVPARLPKGIYIHGGKKVVIK